MAITAATGVAAALSGVATGLKTFQAGEKAEKEKKGAEAKAARLEKQDAIADFNLAQGLFTKRLAAERKEKGGELTSDEVGVVFEDFKVKNTFVPDTSR